jgi:outer membrane lipoprotein-sorting protein
MPRLPSFGPAMATSRVPPTRRRAAVQPSPEPGTRRGARGLAVALVVALVVGLGALGAATWRRHPSELAAPADRSADEVLALVEQRYRTIETLSAAVHLQVTDRTFARTVQRDGRLYLQRGGKLRWDAFLPRLPGEHEAPLRLGRSLISDGAQLFLVDFGNREIVKLHRADDPMILATSYLFAPALAQRFSAQLAPAERFDAPSRGSAHSDDDDGAVRYALVLTPRAPDPHLERLVLFVDARGLVLQLLLETAGNRHRFAFTQQDARTPPQPTSFELDRAHPALAGFRLVDAEL